MRDDRAPSPEPEVLRATLLTDGSSDTVLLPPLRWLLGTLTSQPFELRWADLRQLPAPPKELAERIETALDLYPCTLLFVHRDAENGPPSARHDEIVEATANLSDVGHVAVVPVPMQEAWMLHDAVAIREAAGRPSSTDDLMLPSIGKVESLPNPKKVLHDALAIASGAHGRRAKKFNPGFAAHRLADLITDWNPLKRLKAFRRLEEDTRAALTQLGLAAAESDMNPAFERAGDHER